MKWLNAFYQTIKEYQKRKITIDETKMEIFYPSHKTDLLYVSHVYNNNFFIYYFSSCVYVHSSVQINGGRKNKRKNFLYLHFYKYPNTYQHAINSNAKTLKFFEYTNNGINSLQSGYLSLDS